MKLVKLENLFESCLKSQSSNDTSLSLPFDVVQVAVACRKMSSGVAPAQTTRHDPNLWHRCAVRGANRDICELAIHPGYALCYRTRTRCLRYTQKHGITIQLNRNRMRRALLLVYNIRRLTQRRRTTQNYLPVRFDTTKAMAMKNIADVMVQEIPARNKSNRTSTKQNTNVKLPKKIRWQARQAVASRRSVI